MGGCRLEASSTHSTNPNPTTPTVLECAAPLWVSGPTGGLGTGREGGREHMKSEDGVVDVVPYSARVWCTALRSGGFRPRLHIVGI